MTIKYEPVFGDQSLFEGMLSDCEFIAGAYGYKFKNDSLCYCEKYNQKAGWASSGVYTSEFTPDAMRRIIKIPTWTRADQEAGVLPPVGARIYVPCLGHEQTVIYVSDIVIVSISDSDGAVTRTEVKSLHRISPIEAPEEKAARLEDEFVTSLCKELDGTSLQHDSIYERGVRAAYRKLKAPTND